MKMIDISRLIAAESVTFPGDTPVSFELEATVEKDNYRQLAMHNWSGHLATHVDAPNHVIKSGESIEQMPIDRYFLPAVVLESNDDVVGENDVPDEDLSGCAVLFKTRNSDVSDSAPFDESHVYLSQSAADRLIEKQVAMVGIDYLSVDRFDDELLTVHRMLLENNVLLLENTNMSNVAPGRYQLVAFPLKISGGDGSSVRAVLLR